MPRVCVYGSSSAKTPAHYLQESAKVGEALAAGKHVCINGGGMFGAMGAVNDAMRAHGGTIIGCIHSMWADSNKKVLESMHEVIIVGGDTLAERKRGLNDTADAFIVLPGGPGTWDELWEVVSEVQIGIGVGSPSRRCPVVLVNVDGYYDGFVAQMRRAYSEGIMYAPPEDVVTIVGSGSEAVRAVEQALANSDRTGGGVRTDEARTAADSYCSTVMRAVNASPATLALLGASFAVGVIAGCALSSKRASSTVTRSDLLSLG